MNSQNGNGNINSIINNIVSGLGAEGADVHNIVDIQIQEDDLNDEEGDEEWEEDEGEEELIPEQPQ